MERPTKRRNSEKRKEKSRDAARSRRSRESEILSALGEGLPLPESLVSSLDKASVMRIAISYLKLNQLVATFPKQVGGAQKDIDAMCLSALDGFVMIVSTDGDLVYISENVHNHLGLTQVDLMGNSVYEFSHPCDHDEVREVLSAKSTPPTLNRSFFLRLKCTITAKGRNVNLKSATYKVVHCSGVMVARPAVQREDSTAMEVDDEGQEGQEGRPQYLIAVAEPIPHPSNIEIPLDNQAFVSKHSLDMKFTYADKKIADVLGYSAEDLVGRSFYEFQHAVDAAAVEKPFKSLFGKGQCQTGRYRFLAKGGGFAWVVTQATLLYGSKGNKDSVVCINFLASGVENKNEIYASAQVVVEKEKARVASVADSLSRVPLDDVKSQQHQQLETAPTPAQCAPRPLAVPTRPQPATAKVFAPKTKDMNRGYLMFSDDEPGLTIVKDEPEDLTHLAPTAGDVCMPLALPMPLGLPLLGDMFNDLLSDSYCPLLAEEASTSSCPSRTSADPFFSYREDSNSIHSPTDFDRRLDKSRDDCSLPSLCSPERDEESLGLICLGTDSGGSELDEDLCRTAPYIPLDEQLPLMIPAVDVMWASSPSPSPPPAPPPRTHASALAQLLRGPSESLADLPIKHTDHDWVKDTGQRRSAARCTNSLRAEDMSLGVDVPSIERIGVKRALCGDSISPGGSAVKRARSEPLSLPLPPPRSHSVLMNLLKQVPRENLGTLTEVLKHLCVARNERRREEEEVKQQEIRAMSAYLLQPDPGDAIPSLLDLSQRDCEVNAPVDKCTLLQGDELLTALDHTHTHTTQLN